MDENPYRSPVDGIINDQPSLLSRLLTLLSRLVRKRFSVFEFLLVVFIIGVLISLVKPARHPQSRPPKVAEKQ